jgi:endonuclease III
MTNTTARDLGIDPSSGRPRDLFEWFLASLLFGRPIQQHVAAVTWRLLIDDGLTSPGKFAERDREELRGLLDDGHYARLDYVMTDELQGAMKRIVAEHGSVSELVKNAESRQALRTTLLDFSGIGPKTAEIFLHEIPDKLIGSAISHQ